MSTHSSVLAGESQGLGSLVGCLLWGHTDRTWLKRISSSSSSTCWQSNAQNSPSHTSTVCELWTSKCSSWVLEKAEEPDIKLLTSVGSSKKWEFQKNIYFCFIDYAKAFYCVDHNKLWKILKEMGVPDHLICLLRNLCLGQEATVRTGHGTTDWFQIGKGIRQYCHPAYLT